MRPHDQQPLGHWRPAGEVDRADLYRAQRRLHTPERSGRTPPHPGRAGRWRDRREIRETFKGVSVLGIHAVAITLPILFEEATEAGVQPAPRTASTVHTPVIDQFKATGRFNPDWEAIYQLDPEWLEQFLAMGADLYGGVLEPKLVELMAMAVDASCTHLYTPGIRRHVHGAFAQGATIEEIMDVLKLCGSLGVDACDLGAPILAEELAEHQERG
jgi:alkylhydroperoxidase/carboxymuconolactone decarboxylase family protein YurZ